MKKILLSLLAFGVIAANATSQSKSKTIVCYFSATGNTERLAKTTADALGADLHEIVPVHKYTSADLNWNDRNSLTTKEKNDDKARPAIANTVDLSNYDTVILAYPIWWYMAPKIMYTFVENNNLNGKNLITICTSGGSSLGRSGSDLAKYAKGATFKGGRQFSSRASATDVKTYIEGLLKWTNRDASVRSIELCTSLRAKRTEGRRRLAILTSFSLFSKIASSPHSHAGYECVLAMTDADLLFC